MSKDLDFSCKSVLVVGGSSGIGNGIAQAFRQRGAEVHVWGTRARAADYAGEEGSDLSGMQYAHVEATDDAAVNAAAAAMPKLDILVACQGTVIYKRGEFEMAGFRRVVDVNLNSLMTCALAFKDKLTTAKGSVIFISSTAALGTTFGNPAYNASKAGTLGLTRALAQAWISDGIRVNNVAPGLVDTKLTKATMDNPKRLAMALEHIPARRLGKPADIAGAVLYLASPLADYVIGQTILVDGGGNL